MGRSIVTSVAVALFLAVPVPAISQMPPKDKADKLLDDILKGVTSSPKSSSPPASTKLPEAPVPGKGSPFTKAEIEAVRERVRPCWTGGPPGQDRVVVPIVVRVREDGTPMASYVKDTARFESDPNYRAAANSALRAVMNARCHPWPLPREKYETWRIMTFNFDFGT